MHSSLFFVLFCLCSKYVVWFFAFKLNCLNGTVFNKFIIIYTLVSSQIVTSEFQGKKKHVRNVPKNRPKVRFSDVYRPNIFVVEVSTFQEKTKLAVRIVWETDSSLTKQYYLSFCLFASLLLEWVGKERVSNITRNWKEKGLGIDLPQVDFFERRSRETERLWESLGREEQQYFLSPSLLSGL